MNSRESRKNKKIYTDYSNYQKIQSACKKREIFLIKRGKTRSRKRHIFHVAHGNDFRALQYSENARGDEKNYEQV